MHTLLTPGCGIALGGAVNRAHSLNRGRLAWWLALPGRTSGPTWYDLAGVAHGTLTNGPTWRGPSRPGGYGRVDFDGVDDVILLSSTAAYKPAAAITMAAWVRPNAISGGDFFILNLIPNTGYVGFRYAFGGAEFLMPLSGPGDLSYNAQPLAVGRWSRVVGTYDGATKKLYVDNVLLASQAGTGAIVTDAGPGAIGARGPALEGPWPGAIDDVTVADRAWSAAEVALDFDLGRRGYPGVLNRVGLPAWAGASAAPPAVVFDFAPNWGHRPPRVTPVVMVPSS